MGFGSVLNPRKVWPSLGLYHRVILSTPYLCLKMRAAPLLKRSKYHENEEFYIYCILGLSKDLGKE